MNEELQQQLDLTELADAIDRIDKAMQVLNSSKLKRWVIVELLQSTIGRANIKKSDIEAVLDNLGDLKRQCFKKNN